MDQVETTIGTVANASEADRSDYLRQVSLWTLGGLTLTALVSLLSALWIVPAVYHGGKWAVIAVVYGSFLLSQTVVRKMVYGDNKILGFVLGTALQGIALGFLLMITLSFGDVGNGLALIGNCLVIVLLTGAAMTMYVTLSKHSFSLIGAGISMVTLPLLGLMALQLIFPIGGTLGIVIASVFTIISAATLLYQLNAVINKMHPSMAVQGAYELTLSLVVFFWNLLSLFNRLRRR